MFWETLQGRKLRGWGPRRGSGMLQAGIPDIGTRMLSGRDVPRLNALAQVLSPRQGPYPHAVPPPSGYVGQEGWAYPAMPGIAQSGMKESERMMKLAGRRVPRNYYGF